jgi:alginate O-acetyltransferase complex protein AlgI
MTFNSLAFVFFLPLAYLLYRIFPQKQKWMLLLFASYFFYCFITPWYGILLLFTTGVDFYSALKIESASTKKIKLRWLLLSMISNLLVLFTFKYTGFFSELVVASTNENKFSFLKDIAVPAGLSFYTFQSMSYTIDVYRGKYPAEKHLGLFALFVSFFPHLVAGPVQRYSHLAPQLKNSQAPAPDSIFPSFRLIIWGFFKKMVIADNIAKIVDPIYSDVNSFSGATHLFAGFLFTVQLYCDFSGYTDIATGVAKLFGVDFTLNFKRPLLASSIYSYWKRHNISITSWFREYVYLPLGGNRKGGTRWALNILIVFLVSGFWHGANFTFILWGLLHAIAYLIQHFANKKLNLKLPDFFGWIITISFLSFSYISFRAQNIGDVILIYSSVFSNFNGASFKTELHAVTDWFPLFICFVGILVLFLKEIIDEHHERKQTEEKFPFEKFVRPAFYWVLFFSIFLVGDFSSNEFIYFKF